MNEIIKRFSFTFYYISIDSHKKEGVNSSILCFNSSFTFLKDTVNLPIQFSFWEKVLLCWKNCTFLLDYLLYSFYLLRHNVWRIFTEKMSPICNFNVDWLRQRIFFSSSLKGKRCTESLETLNIVIPIKIQKTLGVKDMKELKVAGHLPLIMLFGRRGGHFWCLWCSRFSAFVQNNNFAYCTKFAIRFL